MAPGFASTLGGQCQLFGHFRGERKSLRGCARPASAVSHRSAPRHAAPPGCAPGAEAGPSRPAFATASPSAPRAPAPALPSAAGGMRCRGGGRGGIHQPSEGGWQGTVRPSQGENTRLRVRHAAPTGRAGSRTVATPRHPRRRSRQARGGATRRPFSRREPRPGDGRAGACPEWAPAPLPGCGAGGLPTAPRCPVRPRPCPVAPPAALPHRGPGPRGPRRSQAPAPPTAAGRGQGGAFTCPPPRCPAPPSLPRGLLPPTAQTGPLSNGEPLSRWFSSDGAHRPGPRFGGIRRSWCLPHARPASSRVLLPRPQGS